MHRHRTVVLAALAACVALPAAAGWVRLNYSPGAATIRSGCVTAGQYERAPATVGVNGGTLTITGLPDAGRCYFAQDGGDELFFDFVALSGGPTLPGAVGALDVQWAPTPPPAAISVTVANYNAAAGEFDLTITGAGAVTMQALGGQLDWCKPGGELGTVATPTSPNLGVNNNDGIVAGTVTLTAPVATTRCDIDPNIAFPGLKFTVAGVSKTLPQPGVLSW